MYTQGFANIGSGEGQQWGIGLSNGGNVEESIHNMYIVRIPNNCRLFE